MIIIIKEDLHSKIDFVYRLNRMLRIKSSHLLNSQKDLFFKLLVLMSTHDDLLLFSSGFSCILNHFGSSILDGISDFIIQ